MDRTNLEKTITTVGSVGALAAGATSVLAAATSGILSGLTGFAYPAGLVAGASIGAFIVGVAVAFPLKDKILNKVEEAAEDLPTKSGSEAK